MWRDGVGVGAHARGDGGARSEVETGDASRGYRCHAMDAPGRALAKPSGYVGGTDICYNFDWFNGVSDGRSRSNGECSNHRASHVSVSSWCFPGDVLHLTHIHLYWSVIYNSFRHWKRCIDGFICSTIFHRMDIICVGDMGSDQEELGSLEEYYWCHEGGNVCGMIEDVHPCQSKWLDILGCARSTDGLEEISGEAACATSASHNSLQGFPFVRWPWVNILSNYPNSRFSSG